MKTVAKDVFHRVVFAQKMRPSAFQLRYVLASMYAILTVRSPCGAAVDTYGNRGLSTYIKL